MSRLLSLKLEDELYNTLESDIIELKIPKNQYINLAVKEYQKLLKKERLKKQFEIEVKLVKESSAEMIKILNELQDGNELL